MLVNVFEQCSMFTCFSVFSIEPCESASDSETRASHKSASNKTRSSRKSSSNVRTPLRKASEEPIVVESEDNDSSVTVSDDETPQRSARHQVSHSRPSGPHSNSISKASGNQQSVTLTRSPRQLRSRRSAGRKRASAVGALSSPRTRKKPLRLITQLDGAGDSSEEEDDAGRGHVSSVHADPNASAEPPVTPLPHKRHPQRRVQFAKKASAQMAATSEHLTSTPLPVARSHSLNLFASPIGHEPNAAVDAESDGDALAGQREQQRLNSITEGIEFSDHESDEHITSVISALPSARRTLLTDATTPTPAAAQPLHDELLDGDGEAAAAIIAPRFLSQSHMRRRLSNMSDLSVLASSFGARDSTDSEGVPLADASRGAAGQQAAGSTSAASSDSQHLVIMCMELLCECRGVLHPDPSADAVLGVFYCVYLEADAKYVCGAVLLGAPQGAPTENSRHTISISNLPDPGLHVREAATELQVITEFLDVLHEYDPDVLLGFEIERMSWSYLLERAAAIGLRSIRQLVSRLALPIPSLNAPGLHMDFAHSGFASSGTGHNGGNKLNDSASNRNSNSSSLLRVGAVPADGLVITGRVVLNLWRLLNWELSLTDYSLEAVALKVLHERYPQFAAHEIFAAFIDDATRYSCLRSVWFAQHI